MKRYLTYLSLTILAVGIASCEKPQESDSTADQQPILFRSFLQEGDKVTPITSSTTRNNAGGNFAKGYMLDGAWSAGQILTSNRTFFMSPRVVNGDGTPISPSDPKLYWKADGVTNHTFLAYTPNPDGTPAGQGVLLVNRRDNQALTQPWDMKFRQPDAPAQQIDLLTADAPDMVVMANAAPAVNLYFRHRLAKVSVRVFGSGATNINDCQAKVTYNAGAPYHSVNHSNFSGMDLVRNSDGTYGVNDNALLGDRHTGTHLLGTPFSVTNAQTSQFNSVLAGAMIFIPQTLATSDWAAIDVEYEVDGSDTKKTASVSLPILGQIRPGKEYIINMNVLEQSQILTITSISLADWTTTSGDIDYLPSEHTLSLSASAPTDAEIVYTGKAYTINVVSNKPWISETNNVTLSQSTGSAGTTAVTITVPANTDLPRSPSVMFSTTGDASSRISTLWSGKQASNKAYTVTIGALEWAIGNLVADGPNGAKIGSTADGGLYFQFGSLIGWKGGATGDGTGKLSKIDGQYYVGTSFNAAAEVAVTPLPFITIGNIGNTWPNQTINQYYFGSTVTTSGSLHAVTGILDGALAVSGVGDPCRYYLGGTWRLPTKAECGATNNFSALTTNNGVNGRWYAVGRTSGWDATNSIWIPASGMRSGTTGSIGNAAANAVIGQFWTSDVSNASASNHVFFRETSVSIGDALRRGGEPIRCVRNK